MLDVRIQLRQGAFQLNAEFTAPSNGITALFGPSGSGKSTLLSSLAGLRRSEGRIALDGRVYADSTTGLHIAPHQRGFGIVFQDARLFPHLTAGQNLLYARNRAPASQLAPQDVAAFFEITELLDRPVGNLSGGEKSRVALARALVSAPDFLLLDEPFAALDGARRRAFIDVLLAAHRKFRIPMLVVSHSIDDAAALASHLVALHNGRVLAQGPFMEVALQPQFQELLDPRDVGSALPISSLNLAREGNAENLWLRADNVLIAITPPQGLSARNILPGSIRTMKAEAEIGILLALETQVGPILARLTPEAARELDLTEGKAVWAVIKAHAT